MKAISKRTERARDREIAYRAAVTFLGAALLAADDLWGLDRSTTEKFTHAFAEICNGYGDEGGYNALQAELAARDIVVDISEIRRG